MAAVPDRVERSFIIDAECVFCQHRQMRVLLACPITAEGGQRGEVTLRAGERVEVELSCEGCGRVVKFGEVPVA